jgi:hypothetical protein
MKRNCVFFVLLLFMSIRMNAQEAKTEPQTDSSTSPVPQSGVVIHADPRLALVLKKPTANNNTPSAPVRRKLIRSGRGYRVQIYSGNDRVKATQIKSDFARRFPGTRTYLSYSAPQFKVKAGDFQSRGDAARLQSQASSYFAPVMIVPDIIVVNTFKND